MTSIILQDIQVSDCAENGEIGADVQVEFDREGGIEWATRLDTGEEYRLTPYQAKLAYAALDAYWQDLLGE